MIESYFAAEKRGGLMALTIGIFACTVGGGILLSAGAPFYTGLSIPLILIGFVEMMVGTTVARRSDQQTQDLEKLLAESPAEFRREEGARMEKILRSFTRFKWIETAFIVLGLAIILANEVINFTKGLGAGLFAQGVVMLIFDIFAEKRSRAYADFVGKQ